MKYESYGRVFEDHSHKKWWLFIRADSSISHYYCWLMSRYGIAMNPGNRHGSHISIVQGETPKDKVCWGALIGAKVEFKYSSLIKYNGLHAWVEVQSKQMEEIRKSLGLSATPWHRFHLTIGQCQFPVIGATKQSGIIKIEP